MLGDGPPTHVHVSTSTASLWQYVQNVRGEGMGVARYVKLLPTAAVLRMSFTPPPPVDGLVADTEYYL